MKRSMPLRNSGFKKSLTVMDREQRLEARAARMANLASAHRAAPPLAMGVIERVVGASPAQPKSEPKRNPDLLAIAKGRECLLCPPGKCRCTPGTTVAAHSNLSIHGKSKGRKADDQFSVWAGFEAHSWLDAGSASAEEKEAAFMAAHLRQVNAWRFIAMDRTEPVRFRRAAAWALDQLNATPLGEGEE
jgi:hypothetical protein